MLFGAVPYIAANVFYYQRINDRIDILQKISEIDSESLADNQILLDEYNRILSKIDKQSDGSLGSVFIKETDSTTNIIKFLSGALMFWVLAISCFFIKGFKNIGYKIFGFILCVMVGAAFGFIARAIPTIITPIVNYIGFPIVIIVVIALLATGGKKKKNT